MDTLRMQIKLSASLSRVFDALTDSSKLTQWFCEFADVSIEGDRYDFWGNYTYGAPGKDAGHHPIVAVVPNRQIKYQWTLSKGDTIVDIKLLEQGEYTILTLLQSDVEGSENNLFALSDFWFFYLENLRRFLDGKSSEVRIDFSEPVFKHIEHTIDVDATPEEVFKVLIRPEEVNRWIASNAKIEPKINGIYDFGWKGVDPLKIVEIRPNERLELLWVEDGNETIVSWILEESGGKTRLTIVQSGFAPENDISGISYGWQNFQGWVRSIAEYGADWQPAISQLREGWETIYPASIVGAQDELILE